MRKIQLFDIKREHEKILSEIKEKVNRAIEMGNFILGEDVKLFEKEVSSFLGTKYAVGVSSGTEALFLSLKALGIKEEDEVITTPFTFIATVEVILRTGAKPVFVDIDKDSLLMDVKKIEEKITKKTKAILPVHLYGNVCDMQKVKNVADRYNLKIIEDCAQSFGSAYAGKKAGNFGDCGCFSFFPAKNLGAFGDAGLIATNDREVYEKVLLLRNHGSVLKYNYKFQGYNARLDTIQAAILRVKLKYIDRFIEKRRKSAQMYFDELEGINEVEFLKVSEKVYHSYNYFTIKVKNRGDLIDFLKDKEVSTAVYYPESLHLLKIYSCLGYKKGDLPVSEEIQNEVLSLPIFASLKEEEIEYICNSIKEFYGY